mgnify:FL=1
MQKSLTRTQQARREDIVSAAIAVIHRDGCAAASVDKIAKEAKTSKSTVLYHFKTKEAIYDEVVLTLFRKGAAYMTDRIAAAGTYRDKLRAYLRSNLQFIAEHAAHVSAVHRIMENGGPGSDGSDPVTPLAALLSAGQQAGEFGSFDPTVTALVIRAAIDGASYHFTTRTDLDFDRYIGETVQLFDKATAASI